MQFVSGTRLGAYEIVAMLGHGGMGDVYRALDTRLGREVAVKVLPAADADRADRRARFAREARAIAALSHPHICTLFDVGVYGGHDFIVMELLQGETLAARMARVDGPLPVTEALTIGAAIAEAVAAAHRAGFVHRDLKPANVMLTPHGVKVLDFGLARALVPAGADATTIAESSAGQILGTLPYMAPEQVEGKTTDPRTDIFALGVVLYELVTGVRPFQGDSTARLTAAILTSDPMPTTERAPLTPLAVDRLVRKCLAKSPDARWQSATDVADELRWIGSTLRPALDSAPAAPSRGPLPPLRTSGGRSAAEELVPEVPDSEGPSPAAWWWRRPVLAAAAIAAIAGALLSAMQQWGQSTRTETAIARIAPAANTDSGQAQHSQVTFDGNVQLVALSPDGQSIAYVAALQDGSQGVLVRDVAGGLPLQLSQASAVTGVGWSSDGTRVLASIGHVQPVRAELIWIPRFGGTPRRIGVCPFFAVSPDGASIACVQANVGATVVRILDGEGAERRGVPLPGHRSLEQVAWIDNQRLALLARDASDDTTIVLVPLEGSPVLLASGEFSAIASAPRGVGLYALRRRRSNLELVRVRVDRPGTDTMSISVPGNGRLSVSRDGRRVAYVRGTFASSLWVAEGSTPPRVLTQGSQQLCCPSTSDDGHTLVATSIGSSAQGIVRIDRGGTVTPIVDGAMGAISPDGRTIAFISRRDGRAGVWVSSVDGTRLRALGKLPPFRRVWWHSNDRVMWQLDDLRGYAIYDLKTGSIDELRPDVPGARWWLGRFLIAPLGDRAVVYVNGANGQRTLTYQFSTQGFAEVLSLGILEPIGWADGSSIIAAETNYGRRVFRVSMTDTRTDTIATFPGRLVHCSSAKTTQLIVCAIGESHGDVWLIDNFDPAVPPARADTPAAR